MTSPPLSTRVAAPAEARLPGLAGYTWRAATLDDVDAITELAQTADRVDHPRYLTVRDEIADDFESSHVNVGTDTVLCFEGGSLVAYGVTLLSPGQETLVRSIIYGGVHPHWRGRGIGGAILAWQEQRALQQLATSDKALPGWIVTYADENAESSLRLLQAAGFEIKRYFLELTRDLTVPIPDVAEPDGVTIAEVDPAETDALLLARNDAFRDHWGSQPTNEEQWGKFVAMSTIRLDLSFVARSADGEIAGFMIASVNEGDWEGQGFSSAYIDLLGVTRAWRGRRVAPALLARGLHAFAAEGLDRAVLDVDSESLTGALSLYEGVGFERLGRSMNLAKVY